MAAPNIVNVSSIYGRTTSGTLTTSLTTDYLSCPSNKVLKVNSIICANIDGSNDVDAVVFFRDSSRSANVALASQITVPAKSTLVVLSKDTAIYLEEGDSIRGGAGANGDLDIIISYEELDDA